VVVFIFLLLYYAVFLNVLPSLYDLPTLFTFVFRFLTISTISTLSTSSMSMANDEINVHQHDISMSFENFNNSSQSQVQYGGDIFRVVDSFLFSGLVKLI
jgi:hypothetical protein